MRLPLKLYCKNLLNHEILLQNFRGVFKKKEIDTILNLEIRVPRNVINYIYFLTNYYHHYGVYFSFLAVVFEQILSFTTDFHLSLMFVVRFKFFLVKFLVVLREFCVYRCLISLVFLVRFWKCFWVLALEFNFPSF